VWMQLFKRVLLSLFPDKLSNNNANPASMFVSFISTKEFFSVINRKIVENYKLNLFDIALDPFELRVGFGEKPSLKVKDLDIYYGYCGVANLNGYRFMNPANISNVIALVSCVYSKDLFEEYPSEYFVNFLYAAFLLSFVFLARLKVFPEGDKEERFNWFVDLFFEFYRFVFEQTSKKLDNDIFEEIKKKLIIDADVLFMLKQFYFGFNDIFAYDDVAEDELFSWLFYDEAKKKTYKLIVADYIKQAPKHQYSTKISLTERKMYSFILPADILLRYLFMEDEILSVVDYIVSKIYDKDILDGYVHSFRKSGAKMEKFLIYLTDYRHFKRNFFDIILKSLKE